MRTADLLVSTGLRDLGYVYVNIDDCWAGPRDNDGNMTADKKAFPSGMPALAEYVHSRGLKLGLYSDVGTTTCAGHTGAGILRPVGFAPPPAASYDHECQDAQTWANWGVDWIKIDHCDLPKGVDIDQFYNEKFALFGRCLNATGRPIFLD
eukprot:gene4044-4389_t